MAAQRGAGVLAVVLAAGLVSTACTGPGDSGGPAAGAASPTQAATTAAPSPGEPIELALGEPASLTLPSAGTDGSEVDLAVTEVVAGDIKDLSDFVLDPQTRRSTPYYATVEVTNTGRGDLSGADVPLWGFDSTGTVRPAAEVVGTFGRCQQEPLPRGFTNGESATTCLMFLLPEGTALEAVQYRFNDGTPPFSWPAPASIRLR